MSTSAACSCSLVTEPAAPKILLYACSGAANVGEIADRVTRQLRADGVGRMACLAGLGGDLSHFVQDAQAADLNLVLDGCPTGCGAAIFSRLGITKVRVVRVTDHGIAKAKGTPVTVEQVNQIVAVARQALAVV